MDKDFIEIDHSGDVGIEARGRDLAGLLENATLGLFSLMYRGRVDTVVERKLAVASSSPEDLLVDWLGEVISACGVFAELYGAVAIRQVGANSVEGLLKGEKIDPTKHDLRFDVKAATYHGLSIRVQGGGPQCAGDF